MAYKRESAFEPIEVYLEGKLFSITKLPQNLLSRVESERERKLGDEEKEIDLQTRILAIYLDVPAAELTQFDLRDIVGALRYLDGEVAKQLAGKDPLGK